MSTPSPRRAGLVVVTALCLQAVTVRTARATSYTVATSSMAIAADDKCSLPEALNAVNFRAPYPDADHPDCPAGGIGPDVISFAPALNGVPLVTTKTLYVLHSLSINGRGVGTTIVRAKLANLASTVFSISSGDGNDIDVTMQDLTIDRQASTSPPQASGVWAAGGSEIGGAILTLKRTRITGQTRGGVVSEGAGVAIHDSTIDGNTSADSGGGVGLFVTESSYGSLWISHSTISGNTSGQEGGGIYFTRNGICHLDDSTVSGNSSSFGAAGVSIRPGEGYVTINGSTIAYNKGIGITSPDPDRVTCTLCIVAKNTGLDWTGKVQELRDSLLGQSATAGLIVGSSIHTLFGIADPKMNATLADNGGNHVKTHALLTGSPAIDYATRAPIAEGDARRLPRGVEGDGRTGPVRYDIGAHERQTP